MKPPFHQVNFFSHEKKIFLNQFSPFLFDVTIGVTIFTVTLSMAQRGQKKEMKGNHPWRKFKILIRKIYN